MHYKTTIKYILLSATAFLLVNCKLAKQQNTRTAGSGAVLDASFVYLERTPNRTEIIVRFRTKVPASCNIRYWPTQGGDSQAVNHKCQNTEPRDQFSEVLKSISPTELYTVEVAVWGRAGAFEYAEKFTVSEGDDALDQNDMFVARVNLQLHTTELHRHRLSSPATADIFKNVVHTDFGCEKEIHNATPYSSAHRSFKAEAITSRGFIVGDSSNFPNNPSFQRLRFNTIAASADWEWSFNVFGQSFTFNLQPASLINNVSVTDKSGSNVRQITDSQLTISPREIFQLSTLDDIQVKWSIDNPNPNSFVVVQIGNNGSRDSLNCFFKADDQTATIPKSSLEKLSKHKNHDILIGVISYQLDLSNIGKSKPAWLVESSDWKLGSLLVQ